MHSFKLLIDGILEPGDLALEVLNPATEEVIATCSRASKRQLDKAVEAARRAYGPWSKSSVGDRKAALRRIAALVEENADALATLLSQEQGKPFVEALAEVGNAAAFFRYFSELELTEKTIEKSETRRTVFHRRPLGVVACIVPWNFPILLMAFKVPAALLAGNTVVLKPAATTPLSTLLFAELVKDNLPPGVLNVIVDDNDLGAALVQHKDVRKVSFTGSTETGRKVMAGAAGTLKRLTLELGGNDAAIVLGDVDPTDAAKRIYAASFINSGQVCIAIKRVYAHEAIYDRLCQELVKLAGEAVVGNGLEDGVTMGPVQNHRQFEKVLQLIEASRRHGRVIAGGNRIGNRGYFIEPTIVADIEDGSPLVDEEQFGPALPVIRFNNVDDVIERVNASDYGLGGSIWTTDIDRGYELAQRLQSGSVWVNKHMDIAPQVPFGGMKQSGVGVELSELGLSEFTQVQVIDVAV